MTKLNEHFEPHRLWALLKLEVMRSRKGIIMTLVIVFDLLFFVGMLLGLYVEPQQRVFEHYEGYTSSLLITGFILSSLAFRDLSHGLRRYNYLALPASAFEKFLSQWLLTSVGWIVLYTLTYTIYTWLANPLGQLIFPAVEFISFNPFHPQVLTTILFYFVLQGVFLVGSVQFHSYAFAKTLGVVSLFVVVCFLIAYVTMKDLFLSPHECSGTGCELFDHFGGHFIWPLAKGLFWWLLAPLTWVITYFGIKEKEV